MDFPGEAECVLVLAEALFQDFGERIVAIVGVLLVEGMVIVPIGIELIGIE